MSKITSYRDLVAWQKAMDLADLVYQITDKFPRHERFGLAFQMRKAAVSIPSNIAEGTRHRTPGYISRVIIALGEHAELETQALLARRRGYISDDDLNRFEELSASVGQLTHGLLRSLESQVEQIPSQSQSIPTNPKSQVPTNPESQIPTNPNAQIPANPKSQTPNPGSI